ncbi:MAG: hypothetical protein H0T46_32395 [Deltaproteobacteria bacterium]|nr:hypothetical protein [Deltaproteobacteria bacterium]
MANDDLTVRVLIEIRDQIGVTNTRLDQLTRRVTENEHTLSTAISEVVSSNREIATLLRGKFDLRERVERCERDILDLKQRVG